MDNSWWVEPGFILPWIIQIIEKFIMCMLREVQNVNVEKLDLKSTFIQGSFCVDHASQRSPCMGFQDTAFMSLPIKVHLVIFYGGKGVSSLLDSQRHLQFPVAVVVYIA